MKKKLAKTVIGIMSCFVGGMFIAGSGMAGANEERPAGKVFTPISDVERGASVVLKGRVERVADEDEFILRDDTGRIRVYIGWENSMPLNRNDEVTVKGRADDDVRPGGRPEIYARKLVLADGKVVNLRGKKGGDG